MDLSLNQKRIASMKIAKPEVKPIHPLRFSQNISLQLREENHHHHMRIGFKVAIAMLVVMLLLSNQLAIAQFGFDQLRDKMESMDAVAIARLVRGTRKGNGAEFELTKIVRSQELVHPNQKVWVDDIGRNLEGTQFLLMGIGQPKLSWSAPIPVSEKAIAYFDAILQLPTDPTKRLEFYLDYLEYEEKLLARDAYTELATSSYEQWVKLKPKLNREKLIEWVSDTNVSSFRKQLYFVLLGICGMDEDRKLIETMLRNNDPKTRNCLSAMIVCYVSICGEGGFNLIDELFTGNEKCDFITLHCYCRALRFLGSSEGIVGEDRMVKSLRLILQHSNAIEVAEDVIRQLMHREDWSQLDRLVELFKAADQDHISVRTVIFHYLRACPRPETVALIEELKEIAPGALRRSIQVFPANFLQNRSFESSNSWDLWDMFAPTSRDWDLYD